MRRTTVDPDRESDVIVLGAGIIGAAVARELTVAGLDAVLVDAGTPGGGTSSRCDGNLLVQTKHDDLGVEMMLRCLRLYRGWADDLDLDIRLDRRGSLVFFTGPDDFVAAEARVERLDRLGVGADLLTADQVHERQPGLCGAITGGVDCYDDASVYPPAVVAALIDDAVARGCRLATFTTARGLLTDSTGRACGVQTDRGGMRAAWVVNAMGIWSGQLETDGVVEIPVRPRQGVLVVTEAAPGLVERAVTEASYMTNRVSEGVGSTAQVSFVVEPTYSGNLLVGSSRRFCGYDTDVATDVLGAIVARARHFMPGLAELRAIRSFAGLRPWSPDNRPIVGESERIPGYVLATGHEGEGIGFAPATAEVIRRQILGEPADSLLDRAADAWSPDRFERVAEEAGVR